MRLATHDVTMRFSGLTALSKVSVQFDQGDIVGLIGPNGSGKTTLLNVVSGILQPTSGEVALGERRWSKATPHGVAGLGVRRTFQNIRLFEELTVLETVEVPLAALRRRQRHLHAALVLEMVGLARYRDRLAVTLPYGLQRRLELARALATDPVFLLLDEPTAGLDDTESAEMAALLRQICTERGCGIVLIDHDLRVIMNTCVDVVVLNEGRVIAHGPPEQVREDPAVVTAYLG